MSIKFMWDEWGRAQKPKLGLGSKRRPLWTQGMSNAGNASGLFEGHPWIPDPLGTMARVSIYALRAPQKEFFFSFFFFWASVLALVVCTNWGSLSCLGVTSQGSGTWFSCLHPALRKPLTVAKLPSFTKKKLRTTFSVISLGFLTFSGKLRAVLGKTRKTTRAKKGRERGCFRKIALKPGIATEHRRGLFFVGASPEFLGISWALSYLHLELRLTKLAGEGGC